MFYFHSTVFFSKIGKQFHPHKCVAFLPKAEKCENSYLYRAGHITCHRKKQTIQIQITEAMVWLPWAANGPGVRAWSRGPGAGVCLTQASTHSVLWDPDSAFFPVLFAIYSSSLFPLDAGRVQHYG